MAEAVSAVTPEPLSVQAAAAQIIRLINSRPQTPWPNEIEAIIAKVGVSKWGGHDEALAVDREALRKLTAEQDAAIAVYGAMHTHNNPAEPAARARQARADTALRDFYEHIWSRPARSIADIGFLAEITYREHWHEQGELSDLRSDEIMEGEPEYGGPADEAMVALLKAIRNVIGPTKSLGADDAALVGTVREAIAREYHANYAWAEHANPQDDNDPHYLACLTTWDAEKEAAKLIPRPPRSPQHVMLLAEVAFNRARVAPDRITMLAIEEESADPFEKAACLLIEAMLMWFGGVNVLGGNREQES